MYNDVLQWVTYEAANQIATGIRSPDYYDWSGALLRLNGDHLRDELMNGVMSELSSCQTIIFVFWFWSEEKLVFAPKQMRVDLTSCGELIIGFTCEDQNNLYEYLGNTDKQKLQEIVTEALTMKKLETNLNANG